MVSACAPAMASRQERDDAMRRAASQGDEALLCAMLKAGAVPDPRKPQITSALQLAATGGFLGCAKALVEAGADVDRVAESSALMDAAAHGHLEVVRFLLSRAANPSLTVNGNTALHMAARFGHQAVVEALSPLMDPRMVVAGPNAEGKSPLMMACSLQAGGESVVAFLLAAGADVAATDAAGNTALHLAAISGNLPVAKMLLGCGKASARAQTSRNGKGRTPLHLAAVFGHAPVAQLLASQGRTDLFTTDSEGSTVLHMLCKSLMCTKARRVQLAELLLGAGADPAAKDQAGNTALHYSSCPALQRALNGGADPEPAGEAATSSSGAAAALPPRHPARPAAPTKAGRLAAALMAGLNMSGDGSSRDGGNWVVKHALRRHTSEEVDGWKLKASGADSP